MKVRLKDVVEALEIQMDELSSFLDLDTGKIEAVTDDLLRRAESPEDEEPTLPNWQKRQWEIAQKIVSTSRFIGLPTKYDSKRVVDQPKIASRYWI